MEQWTLCREHVNRNTVHARSALLTSWLSESGVLTKRDMLKMQSGGIENRWCKSCHAQIHKYKEWHWFLYIFFLFDFINENSVFLISMFCVFFGTEISTEDRGFGYPWYWYKIQKFCSDNTSTLHTCFSLTPLAYQAWSLSEQFFPSAVIAL